MKRIGILTSGGDAPGMNAALRAVVRRGIYEGLEVVGISHGYAGLLTKDARPLALSSVGDIIHRGGTILRTGRSEEFRTEAGQRRAVASAAELGLDGLVVIGGDGSYRGAEALARLGLPVIGIPGTIDNDIYGTELTIGFDTAVNTVLEAVNKIRDTAFSHERTFIIEVMGRISGHIALAAGLAGGAESILVPEFPPDYDEVCARLQHSRDRGKRHSIIIVAEGVGTGFQVGEEIKRRTGFETRTTVLGYIQRGGTPSAADRTLGTRMGAFAVDALIAGTRGICVGIQGNKLLTLPLSEATSRLRPLDRELYELAATLAI
ncbi:MAG: 6-phosphofructokinase [Chloroflexota bacterium]